MNSTSGTALSGESVELLHTLAFLSVQNGRPHEAVSLLEAADRFGKCDARALTLLSLAQLRAGFASRAFSTLQRVDPSPAQRRTYQVVLAQILVALGRREEAHAAIRRAGAPKLALTGRTGTSQSI
ncbi:tetratricopeptide repeat protein [Bordetella genomosp. 9]|uniref:Tetratrico peptide repeat group 5 domain-containing protein n=1 Tax=Bordetella genomosp. 9 TaxID=1416803 RepID=A0A1W6YX32_9BORD|nr:hypothetical protein [Bordetella genomosp. 9]ARP85647.1 hypothetical protein CAL13_05060 [Bordetella genomosp. 9]